MTIVPFVPRREADPWRLDELVELDRLMRLLAGRTGARSWETGVTERGEPQFYVIGPDPEQPAPSGPRKFRIDDLKVAQLVTWAAKGTNLTQIVAEARRHGVPIGDVIPGSRRTPGGVLLSWHISNQRAMVADGLVPFFIDWGNTPHPAKSAAAGATLISLRAEHPDPDKVQRMFGELGLDVPVVKAAKPSLVATIAGTRGPIDLR